MLIRHAPRIDWLRLLMDLERAGLAHREIARVAGRCKTWVEQIKAGAKADVRYHDGMALLVTWSTVTGKPQEQAPTEGSGGLTMLQIGRKNGARGVDHRRTLTIGPSSHGEQPATDPAHQDPRRDAAARA